MKIAVDAGVLVRAYAGEGASQRDCAEAIERVLADDVLVVVANALTEFVGSVTDPKRYEQAPGLSQIAALCNEYAAAANVEIAETGADDLVAALALLREHGLPAERLGVALQAARLRRMGVERLLTADPADYGEFSFIEPVGVLG